MTADTPIVVDIEIWTRQRATAPGTITAYTLVYADPSDHRVYRPATRETEFEARRFARQHGWAANRILAEADPLPDKGTW